MSTNDPRFFTSRSSGLLLGVTDNGDGTAVFHWTGFNLAAVDALGDWEIENSLDNVTFSLLATQVDPTAYSLSVEVNDPQPFYWRVVAKDSGDQVLATSPGVLKTINNDADALAWNNRITAASGDGNIEALQDYVASCKTDGTWDKHTIMLHNWNVAGANLVRSNGSTVASYDGTLSHGGNTMSTNGANNALLTGLVPSSDGWAGMFFYKTSTTVSTPTGVDMGCANASPAAVLLMAVNLSNTAYADYFNQVASPTGGRTTATGQTAAGLYMMWAPDLTESRFSRDNTSLATGAIGGTTVAPTTQLVLGGYRVDAMSITNRIAGSYCASGVINSVLTSGERNNLITRITTLLTALGCI